MFPSNAYAAGGMSWDLRRTGKRLAMVCAMNCALEIPWISLWMLSGKFLAFLAGTGEISTGLEGENASRNPPWDKGFHPSFSPSSPGSRELAIWCLRPLGHLSAQ